MGELLHCHVLGHTHACISRLSSCDNCVVPGPMKLLDRDDVHRHVHLRRRQVLPHAHAYVSRLASCEKVCSERLQRNYNDRGSDGERAAVCTSSCGGQQKDEQLAAASREITTPCVPGLERVESGVTPVQTTIVVVPFVNPLVHIPRPTDSTRLGRSGCRRGQRRGYGPRHGRGRGRRRRRWRGRMETTMANEQRRRSGSRRKTHGTARWPDARAQRSPGSASGGW
jgi:hypothetical protein